MKSLSAFIVTVFLSVFAPSIWAEEIPWYQTKLIGMEVGPSGAQWGSDPRDVGYSSRLNGAEIVAKQIEMGSEYLVLWARDHEWAYYDSKLMPKVPGLGDRDPLKEAVAAAKPSGLPVIAYVVVQAGGLVLRDHPEWGMVGPDGQAIPGRLCLNSPYRDFVHSLLVEMIEIGVDGFHVDMVDQGFGPPYGCFCTTCKADFAKQFPGEAMPTGISWDGAWDRMLEFRYETSARFERDTLAFVRARAPKATVDFNFHGYPPFTFEVGQRPVQHAGIGDFVTCESGVWGFSALAAGMTAEFVRASTPGRRYQVVMQRGARFYHDQTTRPLNDLRWEMFALLMHGSQVTIVDKTPFEGQLDPVAYSRMAEVFKEVQAKREHFGQTPVYDVGIYYSARARDWYGREQREKYQLPFNGAYKAATYEHLTTGVLLDENLSAATLAAYPVVVLPDTAIVGAAAAALFDAYVRGGGNLIVSGNSGCFDAMGTPQSHSSLESLIGAKVTRVIADHDNYVSFDEPEGVDGLLENVPTGWPHLVYGPAVVYEPVDARPLGQLHAPIRTQRQKDSLEGTTFPSPAAEAIGPAILLNTLGKGRVLTFAVSPGMAAGGEYRTTEVRALLANAIRALLPKSDLSIEAPAYVETVVTRDGDGKYRVHFNGFLTPPGSTDVKRPWAIPELMVDTPLYRAEIHARGPIKSARGVNPSTEIEMDGDTASLLVNDVHEVIVLELK